MNELSLSAALTFIKGQSIFSSQPPSAHITIAGKQAIQFTETISTVDRVLPLGDIATIGYILFRNFEDQVSLIIPAAPIVAPQGTGGAATWSYKIVPIDANGNYVPASPAGSTSLGNATLTNVNFNRLTWITDPAAATYDIYRTAVGTSPSTTGKIGNVATNTFDDTGVAGDGTTAPTVGSVRIVTLGSDGTLYPLSARGGEFGCVRWNAAAIHVKATAAGPVFFHCTIIED